MPRQIYILREDFIPRWNLRIAGRYSCPAREHTWIKKGKSCIPRAIFIHRPQVHPLFLKKKRKEKENKHQEVHRRWRQKKYQYRIRVYLFILASTEEYIEDCIAKHKA